ncbi:MAG: HD domain-containing protein [Candidatus Izimaplasma sp.]|nr:HD domain-containing protein [Candidatus Izimaplasma bacterium]
METTKFFAKIISINQTTYDTNTLRIEHESHDGETIRIDDNSKVLENAVYEFDCKTVLFKDQSQLQVTSYTHIDDCDIPFERRQELMETFYEYAPVSMNAVKQVVESYLNRLENKIIKNLVLTIYQRNEKDFYLYPAATTFHHAYIGGLSYHTSTMLKLIDGIMEVYPFLNQDLLIAGIFLHDICKVKELSHYAGPEYTKVGKLIGHITLGVKEVESVAQELGYGDSEEVLLIEHMILSHHYYGNYGSPKKTNIPEALILHFIDNIDSKMTVLKETLDQTEKGEFTSPIRVLDRERYYKSKL